MHISSDRLEQSDWAGYRMNHSPFVCRHASRGRITYILRGSPTIPSMIPMVLLDDTPTGCMPHGQTVLAGILPSSFTPSSRLDIVRSRWQPTAYACGGTIDVLSNKSQPTSPGKSTPTDGTCIQHRQATRLSQV
jgi:hypothetical protein